MLKAVCGKPEKTKRENRLNTTRVTLQTVQIVAQREAAPKVIAGTAATNEL